MHTRARRTARLAVLIALLLGALGTRDASAQGLVTVRSGFSQQVCYLGDQVVYEITVENSDSVDPPDLSGIPGASFNFRGISNESRTMVSIVNGRRSESVVKRLIMRWTVTPSELGTLIVPPMLVKVDQGQVVETDEARVRVLEPEQEDRPVVIVRPESDTLYVNQSVRVRVSWLLTADIEDYSFRASPKDDALLIQPVQRQRTGLERAYPVEIFGVEASGTLGYGTLDGERVRSLDFELVVTPTEAGTIALGPITVSYNERVSRTSVRRVVARSGAVEFEVRDLPAQGRPDNFDGLLGTHDIEARAEPTTVSVGDPINLEVTIYGPEPMAAITDGPDLSAIPAFADNFRIASEGWTFRPGSRPGERTFSTVIRVADADVTEIPAITLPFFDPGEGEYRVARSEAIPLTVRAVREVTAADAVVSSAAPQSVSRDPLTATGPGVWAIERGAGVLATADPLAREPWRNPAVIVSACVPPACFAGALVLAARRRSSRDPERARRARALRSARRVLAREGAVAAVRTYLADAFGATPAAITGADGERLLRDAGIDDPAPVVELIASAEAASYARAGGPATDADRRRVETLLARIDGQLRRTASAKGGAS